MPSKKCEHGKQKHICRDCGGSSFCEHDKRKSRCRDCGGSSICEHGKQKQFCRDCGGSAFCEHDKIKSSCRDCGGSRFCEHNKRKSSCRDCGGSSFCEHNKIKSTCRDCGGSSFCEHNKIKTRCKSCGGGSFCEHNKIKSSCRDCGGSQICEHNKRKSRCRDCGGSSICEHNKIKSLCKSCGGRDLCKSSWCDTRATKKYENYCMPCFVNNPLNADKLPSRNHKTKETEVVNYIRKTYHAFDFVADKRVINGCSSRRPDLLLDLGSHIIIIEVDENKHSNYECSCENKRLMQLSQDLQHRPIVFIRFNPDAYTDVNNKRVSSCWKLTMGVLRIAKKGEWIKRLETLKQQITYWIENPSDKTVEIVELFY